MEIDCAWTTSAWILLSVDYQIYWVWTMSVWKFTECGLADLLRLDYVSVEVY